MTADPTAEASTALAGMATALDADGYALSVVAKQGVVDLHISASAEACEECLVAAPQLEAMAADALATTALAAWEVRLDRS